MEPNGWSGLLGNGAVTLVIVALISLYQKLRENRTTLRSGLEMREQMRNDNDRSWINTYRAAAEAHLIYDQQVLLAVGDLRYEIQRLRSNQGLQPTEFPPLPKAPPLFPDPQPIQQREG